MILRSGKKYSSNCLKLSSRQWQPTTKATMKKLILMSLLFLTVELNYAKAAPMNKGNSRKKVTIISKEGKYLTIFKSKVRGEDTGNSYSKLELQSSGLNGEVTIKGLQANRFLIMKSNGQVSLSKKSKKEAIFIDVHLSGSKGFRSFRSKLYPQKYLAITPKGLVTNSTAQHGKYIKFAVFDQ